MTKKANISKASIKKKIQDLKTEILKHDHLYYSLDKPQITDYEYDRLYKELADLEARYPEFKTEDSPSQKIPGKALEKFQKADHSLPMLSLQNSYSKEEIKDFYNRILKLLKTKDVTCFLEPKLDGVAVELIYKKGRFTKALTRGDGKTGEDVTKNIKTLKGLPLVLKDQGKSPSQIPDLLEVRGEVLILKKDFQKINQEQEEKGEAHFANPRNLAAGSLRQLNPKVTASRPLHFFAHSPGEISEKSLNSQERFLEKMKDFSIPSFQISSSKKLKAPLKLCSLSSSIEGIWNYYDQMLKMRHPLPFETDGIVIKVNDFEIQKRLGSIARSPRWAMAGKFPPEQGVTKIEDIKLQVGRTGVVTPVAVLKPISLGGVFIRQASLHNFQDLKKKDVRIHDEVLVHRAGDVIPEVIKPVIKKGVPRKQAFKPPTKCPECKSSLQSHGDYLVCKNEACPGVMETKLIHFASKPAMNIEFLGKKSIQKFYEFNWLKSFSDFYALENKNIKEHEGFGEKSYNLLVESLNKSKKTSLPRFLFALGIPLIGEQTAQKISEKVYARFNDSKSKKDKESLNIKSALLIMKKFQPGDLEEIEDIGPLVAKSFTEAFQNKEFQEDIMRLHKTGIHFAPISKQKQTLSGKTFVITGTLPEPRSLVKKQIEEKGGRVQSQVSQKTSYLLVGENPGSKKKQAESLKVPSLNWEDFLKMR